MAAAILIVCPNAACDVTISDTNVVNGVIFAVKITGVVEPDGLFTTKDNGYNNGSPVAKSVPPLHIILKYGVGNTPNILKLP